MTDATLPLANTENIDIDDVDELADLIAEAGIRRPSFTATYEDATLRQVVLTQLIKIRRDLGITQKQVAERMQTTQSAISDLENGLVDFHLSTLQRYARAVTARVLLSVDMPHDSPWCDAWFYARSPNATKVNSDRPPTPPRSYAKRWRSSSSSVPVAQLDKSRTSYVLAQ
jgi:transcriptional regulator with XRE-family HTH domain